jgi:hypothetical protein
MAVDPVCNMQIAMRRMQNSPPNMMARLTISAGTHAKSDQGVAGNQRSGRGGRKDHCAGGAVSVLGTIAALFGRAPGGSGNSPRNGSQALL